MMNKSESIKELATALNKAQGEMSGASKSSKNPFFKSNYADLSSVIEAIKEPFHTNGLSYSQMPVFDAGCVGVETILMHTSGEYIESKLLLPMVKQDPQAAGSAITYARRYSLMSIAGIPAEDDDGNATRATKQPTAKDNKPFKPVPIDLAKVAYECGWKVEQVCNSFDPPLKSINDVQDVEACAEFLRANSL